MNFAFNFLYIFGKYKIKWIIGYLTTGRFFFINLYIVVLVTNKHQEITPFNNIAYQKLQNLVYQAQLKPAHPHITS